MSSCANVTGVPSRKALNFHTFFTPTGNRVDMVVLVDSIRAISERFANTPYGFFLGKRVAYPVVANYFRNTWGKYGLVKSMLNSSTGIFSFQFSSMDGLDVVLEIEDVGNVSVWIKLHGVPVTASNDDGLSATATKVDTHLMRESYTSDMCIQSWGMPSYARALIEVQADVELKDNITDECLMNIDSDVVKNLKKPSQAPKGVSVGPKVRFKPVKQV
ncbi:hypothetical protein Tco_0580713 [Tanacetum coccineum]